MDYRAVCKKSLIVVLMLNILLSSTVSFASDNLTFGSDYQVRLNYFVAQLGDFEDLYYNEMQIVGYSDVIQYVNQYNFSLSSLGSSQYYYNYIGTQFKFFFNRYFNYGESRVISFTIKPSFNIRSIYVTETLEDTTMGIDYTEHLLYSETCSIGAGDIYNFRYNYNMRYNGPNRIVNVYFVSDRDEQIKSGTWYLNDIDVAYFGDGEEVDSSGGILAFIKNIFARLGSLVNLVRELPEHISNIVSSAVSSVTGFFSGVFDDIKAFFSIDDIMQSSVITYSDGLLIGSHIGGDLHINEHGGGGGMSFDDISNGYDSINAVQQCVVWLNTFISSFYSLPSGYVNDFVYTLPTIRVPLPDNQSFTFTNLKIDFSIIPINMLRPLRMIILCAYVFAMIAWLPKLVEDYIMFIAGVEEEE